MQPLSRNAAVSAVKRPIFPVNDGFLRSTYVFPEVAGRFEPLIFVSAALDIDWRYLYFPGQILGNTGRLVAIGSSHELQQAMENDFAFNHALVLKNLVELAQGAEMPVENELQLSTMLNTICRGTHLTVFPVQDRPTILGLVRAPLQLPNIWHETRLLRTTTDGNLNLMRQNMLTSYDRWLQERGMAHLPRVTVRQSSLHVEDTDAGQLTVSACNEVASVLL